MELKENALIVSDIHYHPRYRRDFLNLLSELESSPPPQLILLGDIFDLLFGEVDWTISLNRDVIERLDKLGKKIEITYFEGNHDFNLGNIFNNIHIVPISKQPMRLRSGDIDIFLAHGDFQEGGIFYFYRRVIENRYLLKFLNWIDTKLGNIIIKHIEKREEQKEKCYQRGKADIRFQKERGIYIYGHFHQNRGIQIGDSLYLLLSSFACNKSSFVVKLKRHGICLKKYEFKDFE